MQIRPQHFLLPLLALFLVACEREPLTAPMDEEAALEAEFTELEAQYHAEVAAIEAEAKVTPKGGVVMVPAGSTDALAAAVAEAGPNGTVILAAGDHHESGTVLIPHRIRLQGQPGSVLFFDTDGFVNAEPGNLEPGLHLRNADRSFIYNLDIRAAGEVAGTAILVEDSDRTVIFRNRIDQHQFGVLIHKSNFTSHVNNQINASLLWTIGQLDGAHGIVNMNGKHTRIYNNTITGGFSGIFPCDEYGFMAGNELFGNYTGMILCKVPTVIFLPGRDEPVGAEIPGTGWNTFFNDAHDNFDTGYLIIDGARANTIRFNSAANNARVDYDYTGVTSRFGTETPTSRDNRSLIRSGDTYLDCGVNNTFTGGTEVFLECF